jgi:hypothetical protein
MQMVLDAGRRGVAAAVVTHARKNCTFAKELR